MIFRIPAGKHRARPFRFGFWWRRTSFAWVVKFDESCRYDLQSDDQFDTNKLVGVGYLPGHHKESARFGWRYWTERGEIELSAYCYINGQRVIKHVGFCEIGKTYRIELRISTDAYYFACDEKDGFYYRTNGEAIITHGHRKRFSYRLGVFFGGNRTAPHEIKIDLSKS
jgi:hypothetical protein